MSFATDEEAEMQELRAVLSTSEVDKHGDVMTVGALHSFADHINCGWIPVGIQHDPRIPPHGRVVRAEVKQRDDGVYFVEGTIQLFEPGDIISDNCEGRELPIQQLEHGEYMVKYDRTFEISSQIEDVARIAELFDVVPSYEMKKSIDPISVLTIAIGVALGSFSKSFFGKLGEELGSELAERLKALFNANSKRGSSDQLLVFLFASDIDGSPVEFQVVLTNPTDAAIRAFLGQGVAELDRVAKRHCEKGTGIRRIVYEYEGGLLKTRFGVRRDAVPMYPDCENDSGGEQC